MKRRPIRKLKPKGGEDISLLDYQQKRLEKLEVIEPISEATENLLVLVIEFLTEARELKARPQQRKTEAEKKLELLQEKMILLNKVSATGKELLQGQGIC